MNQKQLKIVIIDYQMSNIFSVKRACETVGMNVIVTSDSKDIINADAVILPGVGAFKEAFKNLEKMDFIYPIKDFIASGKPFMGICLGMQLLMTESEEFGNTKGLDIIPGNVIKFSNYSGDDKLIRVPFIGWNKINIPKDKPECWNTSPLTDISDGEFMYFVHSFYVKPASSLDILSLTNYKGIEYCSSLLKDNIFAAQFHPEKSCTEGMKIYRNFKNMIVAKEKNNG